MGRIEAVGVSGVARTAAPLGRWFGQSPVLGQAPEADYGLPSNITIDAQTKKFLDQAMAATSE